MWCCSVPGRALDAALIDFGFEVVAFFGQLCLELQIAVCKKFLTLSQQP
nr:hypothetical protein [Petrachloros mirabilis]